MNGSNHHGKPAFLITIDTEGDNLWEPANTVTTENSRFLGRFQNLCEEYALKPTWLTNFEMAECPRFLAFGHEVLKRNAAEIGMHLHAWNSPPLLGNLQGQPYLIEYPSDVMAAKIKFITQLLENRFEEKMVSHRAGRWAFNAIYARLLAETGYLVDCSVTPHVSWAHVMGSPRGSGGTDYRDFPALPYFMNLDRIDCEGTSVLLEVPVTIVSAPTLSWLRPNGSNLESMLGIIDTACEQKWPCVEFMLHSSELMAGGSPTFQTHDDIEALYGHLHSLFRKASQQCRASTLKEFRNQIGST